MKSSLILAMTFAILLLVIPLMSADSKEDTLTIKMYNTSKLTNNSMNIKIEFISSTYKFDNNNFTFTVNLKNGTVFSSSITKTFPSFDYWVQTTAGEILNIDYKVQYDQCIFDKGQLNKGWDECRALNATGCKKDLDVCTLDLKQKDIDISTKDDKITTLQTENDGTKNSKWLFGVGGIILGIVILLFYEGKIGKGNPREKSMGEFNKGQTG